MKNEQHLNLKAEGRELSKKSILVLNYLKKHESKLKLRWMYGIQVYKVVKGKKELSYPVVNEDTFCEILKFLEEHSGEYAKTLFYKLRVGGF